MAHFPVDSPAGGGGSKTNVPTLPALLDRARGTWELSCRRMWETAGLPEDPADTQQVCVLQC